MLKDDDHVFPQAGTYYVMLFAGIVGLVHGEEWP